MDIKFAAGFRFFCRWMCGVVLLLWVVTGCKFIGVEMVAGLKTMSKICYGLLLYKYVMWHIFRVLIILSTK